MKEKIEKNKERGKRTMEKLRKNKGITLIALVITIITIIVLLILARSINCYANKRQWNSCTSTKS